MRIVLGVWTSSKIEVITPLITGRLIGLEWCPESVRAGGSSASTC